MKITATTYEELEKRVILFDKGVYNVLFVIGDHGQGKTRMVEKHLGKKAQWLAGGNLTAYKLYMYLYKHRDKTFVLDDMDQLYSDATSVRLLKSLTQTEEVKTVGWMSKSYELEKMDIPESFQTRSRVVIVLNKWQSVSKHVEALENRGLLVEFEPTFDELMKELRRWFKDKQMLDFVVRHRDLIKSLNFRDLIIAKKAKDMGDDSWDHCLKQSLGIYEMVLVKELLGNPRFITHENRVVEFAKQTRYDDRMNMARTRFFDLKRKLEDLAGTGKPRAIPVVPRKKRAL